MFVCYDIIVLIFTIQLLKLDHYAALYLITKLTCSKWCLAHKNEQFSACAKQIFLAYFLQMNSINIDKLKLPQAVKINTSFSKHRLDIEMLNAYFYCAFKSLIAPALFSSRGEITRGRRTPRTGACIRSFCKYVHIRVYLLIRVIHIKKPG